MSAKSLIFTSPSFNFIIITSSSANDCVDNKNINTVSIDAKSGVSGAGRSASLKSNFSEVNENVFAYSVDGHRHLAEVTQELGFLNTDKNLKTTMLTHLIPITRGIIVSCYVNLEDKGSGIYEQQEISQIYNDFYSGKSFVKISDNPPSTKQVSGTNGCVIYCTLDKRTNRLIIISCIDNFGSLKHIKSNLLKS